MSEQASNQLVTLSSEEDTFCLAVIEYGGNLPAAYRSVFGDVPNAGAKARLLIARPEIAKRVHALTIAVEESALVSLGSHLVELARIRDLAVQTNQLKVAMSAERSRGEAAGFYAQKSPMGNAPGGGNGRATVNVFIGNTPATVEEWGGKHGNKPVVIDV